MKKCVLVKIKELLNKYTDEELQDMELFEHKGKLILAKKGELLEEEE